jgi:predicted Fe-Mo cluster-binding NifX family protein
MQILISSQKDELSSPVDERFGRAPWLINFDTETNEWKAYQNPGVNYSSGAGVAAAQFVIDQKAEVVISGDFGPHAAKTFQAAKIEMRLFTENVVTVQDAIDQYQNSKLPKFQ